MRISLQLKPAAERRCEPLRPAEPLPFGVLRTDHMFLMDHDGTAWKDARIVPYGPLRIAPGAIALHYGQSIFEGVKAFKHQDGEIYTFRLDRSAERLNASAAIMCLPQVPIELQLQAVHALIDVERLWFPEQEGASLYVRPFLFGSSDNLGVKPSKECTFAIILSPSGPYYASGFTQPIKLLITQRFHRAAPGGSGAAKAAGNYGASMRAGVAAHEKGASQVLYLDCTNTWIEEAGAMNHFHVTAHGHIIIPQFSDTILRSVTSESVLALSGTHGIKAQQARIALQDLVAGVKSRSIVEAGGLGTAAVVTAVGSYVFDDGSELVVGDGRIGTFSRRLYDTLTGIQNGRIPAPPGWLRKVERARA